MSRARKRYDSGKMPEEDYLDEQDRFYFVKRDFRRKNNQQKKNHESIRELRNQREQIKSELMARVENGGY
jgi:endo-alpha-1,4-polygalactosaminidase (GH114 family)